MILNRLTEGVGEPGHPAILHSDREIASLDVRRADLTVHRVADDRLRLAACTDRRAVPLLFVNVLPEDLDDLSVIHVLAESELHGIAICAEAVCA